MCRSSLQWVEDRKLKFRRRRNRAFCGSYLDAVVPNDILMMKSGQISHFNDAMKGMDLTGGRFGWAMAGEASPASRDELARHQTDCQAHLG